MAEGKMEITRTELLVYFGVVAFAIFILIGGQIKLFDPLVAGIAVIAITVAFLFANYLETKGIFAGHTTNVFMMLVLGILMIIAGLISRGVIPLVLATGYLILDIALNTTIYVIVAVIAIVAVLIYAKQKKLFSAVATEKWSFFRRV